VSEARLTDPEGGGDERVLVEAAQSDPAQFGELYELHFDRVYAFIARRIRDRAAAEDLTSEVFHKALANIRQFEWRGIPFVAWLIRIAANAIADRAKREARERALPSIDVALAPPPEADDRSARLYSLVRELPADQRRVVLLRFSAEKSIRDVAEELGRSEGAVKQLQFRALETLRARMGEFHG
jgi:RNA polymerase sigma-70 factor (ECF subfamily)